MNVMEFILETRNIYLMYLLSIHMLLLIAHMLASLALVYSGLECKSMCKWLHSARKKTTPKFFNFQPLSTLVK